MALKKSELYKHTEVRVIPEDWNVKLPGELATFRTRPFGSALHKSDYIVDGTPIINPMHIVEAKIAPASNMTISPKAAKQPSEFG